MDVIYDVCVVGAGLWGSSAAYHLTTLIPECKVCLIGPKEPTKEVTCNFKIIFCRHKIEKKKKKHCYLQWIASEFCNHKIK